MSDEKDLSVEDFATLLTEAETDNDEDTAEDDTDEDAEADQAEADEDEDEAEEDDNTDDDDEADEDEGDPDPHPDDLHTVPVNGQEVQVTLEELKRGYSGQTHIRNELGRINQVKQELGQREQAIDQALQHVQILQEQGAIAPPPPPPSRMDYPDPMTFLEAEAHHRRHVEAYQDQQHQIASIFQQRQAMQQRDLDVYLQEQHAKLAEAMPEFGKPEWKGVADDIVQFAQSVGFSEQEIQQISQSAPAIVALHKAAQWEKLQKSKPQAKAKARNAPKLKSGSAVSRKSRGRKAAKAATQRLRETGSTEAFAGWLLTDE